MFPVNS